MQNPQGLIVDIYKTLSPLVIELQEKNYTKYLASKIGGNITTILDILVNSKYCQKNKQEYSNKTEPLAKILEYSNQIKNDTKSLLQGSYFTQRGGNQQHQNTFIKINQQFTNIYKQIKENLEIQILPFFIDDVNNSNSDTYLKIDEGLQKAEQKQDKTNKLMNEINNDLCYIIWIEGNGQKLQEIQVKDFLDVFKNYDDSFQSLDDAEKNIEDLLNINGLNSWKNYADFINYVWSNPQQKSRLFQQKPVKIDNKILELEVIRNSSKDSNFTLGQIFIIGQNGLISNNVPNIIQNNDNNNEQNEIKKTLNHGIVTFGRNHPSYPVPNDVQFNKDEEKISRRQFTIRHNDEKGKYELVCTSLVNFTEFLVTSKYKYPIMKGSIIGIKDLIFFEVKSLQPDKKQEKLNTNYVSSQNRVSQQKEITKRMNEHTSSLDNDELIHKFENKGEQTQSFQSSEFSCQSVEQKQSFTQQRKDNARDDDSDDQNEEDQDQDQEEQKDFQNQTNKKKQFNAATENEIYYKQRNKIIEKNNSLQEQNPETDQHIQLEVQFARRSITEPKKGISSAFSKSYLTVGHKSGDGVDIKIDCDQLQAANQFFIFMDENKNWYVTAPQTGDISFQLKLSHSEKESSRPFQLKQNEIIQVQETRFQVNYKNKQQSQQQQQKQQK